ncbi:Aspartate aminotransferase [Serratia marcescens]|uniref:Aspartate aminotransferase n=1 Tax=Serratia marcescens TaxID=615 RepID=A0A380A662_SERMA|nr:Aspartate aminotransferase [Serratia marcescens]
MLTSVKKAEQYLLENETTKNYLGIEGIPAFASCTQELLFGKESPIVTNRRARTAQTPGGTGGLRRGGRLYRQPDQRQAHLDQQPKLAEPQERL